MAEVGLGSQCFSCRWWLGEACEAYPSGIPEEILRLGASHSNFRGDEEAPVHYELNPGQEDELEAWVSLRLELQALEPDLVRVEPDEEG